MSMWSGLRPDFGSGRPRLVRHRLAHRAWPRPRLTIGVLSDLHAGGWWTTRSHLRRAVDLVNAEAPDLTLFAGDAVADRNLPLWPMPVEDVAGELARLFAPLGVFAVLGNHDWSDDLQAHATGHATCAVEMAFEATGLPVLRNRATRLDVGDGLWLVGLDSRRALHRPGRPGFDDRTAAFRGVPVGAPSILLAHEPDVFAEEDRPFLQVSGHTHGGQIAPLGWTPVVPSDHGARYAWGHIVEDGRHLVVSGGLGFTGLPLRVGRPPEITFIAIGGD
ncbi:metallophosphoesterase [Roseitranquillus sediminis]|uniref:metallophosphoesterase n=1 Tax=Roseitranquillus sediminis TaxID=2809051 RepID=UPI001D0C5F85|nr:metallophosphoesterase [Roseitranquillus sediminis]MBM9593444.1 metallophosphoesterase [Roseitranquillus sediminis]